MINVKEENMNITNRFEKACWDDWTYLSKVQSKQRKNYYPFRIEEHENKMKVLENERRKNCNMYLSQKETLKYPENRTADKRREISDIMENYAAAFKNKTKMLYKNETQEHFDEFVREMISLDKQRFEECLQVIIAEKERLNIEDAVEGLLMLSKEKPKKLSRKEMLSNLPPRKSKRLELKKMSI